MVICCIAHAGKRATVNVYGKMLDCTSALYERIIRSTFHCFRTLLETLRNMDLSKLVPFRRGTPEKFANFLDSMFSA